MNLVDPRGNFLQPGVQGHPECICGWRKALQMGHAVLPWESSPSILDRWLSPGLCLDTSKVEAPAAWPGRHSLPLLGSSRCGESPRSSYNSAPQGAQLSKCASNGPTPASWNLNPLVLDAPLEPGNTEASQAPGAPRPSPSRWGSRTFSSKPGPVDPSPGPRGLSGAHPRADSTRRPRRRLSKPLPRGRRGQRALKKADPTEVSAAPATVEPALGNPAAPGDRPPRIPEDPRLSGCGAVGRATPGTAGLKGLARGSKARSPLRVARSVAALPVRG